jgi:hypothetical protein
LETQDVRYAQQHDVGTKWLTVVDDAGGPSCEDAGVAAGAGGGPDGGKMRGSGRGPLNAAAKCGDRKGQGGVGEDAEPLVLFGRIPSLDRARKLVKVSHSSADSQHVSLFVLVHAHTTWGVRI